MNRVLLRCLIVASFVCAGAAQAAPVEPTAADAAADSVVAPPGHFAWSATYASWYSFQGLDYSERHPVLQPQLTTSTHGVSFGLWGNLDQLHHELNEVDATLQVEREVGPVTAGLGYGYLRYPNRDWEATQEIVGSLGLSGAVEASLDVHWDIDAGSGRYWTLGVTRDATLHKATATLGAKLYVQDHYYGLTGVPALETSFAVSTPLFGLPLQPSLSRLWTWENGDFRGDQAIESRWMMSLTFSSP